MKTSFLFVAALSFTSAGCPKKGGGASNDCAKAVAHSMDLSKAEMEKMPGMDTKLMQKMTEVGVQRCKDDKWSGDAIKCMTDAITMTDAQKCYDKLTQDQRDKMQKAAMEMAMSSHGAGSAGSATDSAGSAGNAAGSTGSAAGSDGAAAGSGSAAAGSGETGSAAAAGSGSAGSAAAPK